MWKRVGCVFENAHKPLEIESLIESLLAYRGRGVYVRRPYDEFVLFAAFLKVLHKTMSAPGPFPWRMGWISYKICKFERI